MEIGEIANVIRKEMESMSSEEIVETVDEWLSEVREIVSDKVLRFVERICADAIAHKQDMARA